jgi:hypothetical protein
VYLCVYACISVNVCVYINGKDQMGIRIIRVT